MRTGKFAVAVFMWDELSIDALIARTGRRQFTPKNFAMP